MTRTQSLILLSVLTGCPVVVPEEPEPDSAEVLPAEGEWALRLSEVAAYGDCGGYYGYDYGYDYDGSEGREPSPVEPDGGAGDEDLPLEDDGEDVEVEVECGTDASWDDCVEPMPEPGYGYGYGYEVFGDMLLQADVRQRGRRGFVMDIEGLSLVAQVRDGAFEASGGEYWDVGMPEIMGEDLAVASTGAAVDCVGEPELAEEYCGTPDPSPAYGLSLYAEGELEGPTAMHGVVWVDVVEGGWFCSLEMRFDAARLSDFRDDDVWDGPVVMAEGDPGEAVD